MSPPRVNSSLCTFCKKSDETIVHLFVECEYSQKLWSNLISVWKKDLAIPSKLSTKQILLGDASFSLLLNHVILITKKTIYDCKFKSVIPIFEIVKVNVKLARKIEFYIAYRNKCIDKARTKWEMLKCET